MRPVRRGEGWVAEDGRAGWSAETHAPTHILVNRPRASTHPTNCSPPPVAGCSKLLRFCERSKAHINSVIDLWMGTFTVLFWPMLVLYLPKPIQLVARTRVPSAQPPHNYRPNRSKLGSLFIQVNRINWYYAVLLLLLLPPSCVTVALVHYLYAARIRFTLRLSLTGPNVG